MKLLRIQGNLGLLVKYNNCFSLALILIYFIPHAVHSLLLPELTLCSASCCGVINKTFLKYQGEHKYILESGNFTVFQMLCNSEHIVAMKSVFIAACFATKAV